MILAGKKSLPIMLNNQAMNKKTLKDRLFNFFNPVFQRVFITIQFFDEKGMANHAAGGAYGFLLSAAPTLLLVVIFIVLAYRSTPYAVTGLIQQDFPFLKIILNEDWINDNISGISRSGIPGIISVASLILAGRVFALSLQRGLKVIFFGKKTRNPIKENVITFLIQLFVPVLALFLIASSQVMLFIFSYLKFFPDFIFAIFKIHIFPFAALGIMTYCAYRTIPANPPCRLSALRGSLFCTILYSLTFFGLQFIINKTRYNFLYGTLGDLIILLISVYFFFIFFFMGAQYTKVTDSLDVLILSNFLKVQNGSIDKQKILWRKLFTNPDGKLSKYLRFFRKGDTIIRKGDHGNEIFYLLEGKAEVFFHRTKKAGGYHPVLESGAFFGEMEHLLSDKRTATVIAVTDITVLSLPPFLFDEVLDSDIDINHYVIDNLTKRLKDANECRSEV